MYLATYHFSLKTSRNNRSSILSVFKLKLEKKRREETVN